MVSSGTQGAERIIPFLPWLLDLSPIAIVAAVFCYFDSHWPSLDISLGSNAERPRRIKVQ